MWATKTTGVVMGIKDEIREAKAIAEDMRNKGEELSEIIIKLNCEFEGFYYRLRDGVCRENVPDYLPAVKII